MGAEEWTLAYHSQDTSSLAHELCVVYAQWSENTSGKGMGRFGATHSGAAVSARSSQLVNIETSVCTPRRSHLGLIAEEASDS